MYKGIDVSRWQGSIDFVKVKSSGIDFVIVKAGGSDSGLYTDKNFHYNVRSAQAAGLAVGTYYFVGKKCKSANDGIADAIRFSHIIKDYKFEYPVFIDFEAPDRSNKQGNTEACIGFCRYMESLGYYAGIYASDISGLKTALTLTSSMLLINGLPDTDQSLNMSRAGVSGRQDPMASYPVLMAG